MPIVTRSAPGSARLRKSGVQAKLWPNGEISFHLPKRMKELPLVRKGPMENRSIWAWWIAAKGLGSAVQQALLMGLSNVTNFDKKPRRQSRSGLRGITSLGGHRVRNACYLLTREAGKHRLSFSTVTVPNLSEKHMVKLHLRWHEVIDRYRLLLSRQLISAGLTGEIVGVSEVQEKRYDRAGFPVLHAHFIFVGCMSRGGWIITPDRHDYIWRKSLESVLSIRLSSVSAACKLQPVRKDAAGYLGKYMSKGTSAVASAVADGFEWALPKQWWNCSRSLSKRMSKQIRNFTEGVPWLIAQAVARNADIWAFYKVVTIEMPDGELVDVGSYGKLSPEANGTVRRFLGL